MSMIYLANVQSIAAGNTVSFFTPYEHVAVDYPRDGEPSYIVSSYYDSDMVRTNELAVALDMAVAFLQRAELRANKFYI